MTIPRWEVAIFAHKTLPKPSCPTSPPSSSPSRTSCARTAGVDGDAQRISQLTWLLFLKVFDALEEELELTRDAYTSPIPETCAGATGPPTPKA
jgi:hypothetical protein